MRTLIKAAIVAALMLMPSVAMAHAVPTTSSAATTAVNETSKAVNKIIDKSAAALAEISSKLESAAPKAWNLVVKGTEAKATAGIVIGGGLLVWCAIAWIMCYKVAIKASEENNCGKGVVFVLFAIASGLNGVVSGIWSSTYLLSADVWTAFLSPEGYIALQILNKAVGQ